MCSRLTSLNIRSPCRSMLVATNSILVLCLGHTDSNRSSQPDRVVSTRGFVTASVMTRDKQLTLNAKKIQSGEIEVENIFEKETQDVADTVTGAEKLSILLE